MKRLDMSGITRHASVVAFVAIFAIASAAYLASSHANGCGPISGPMSGPVSGSSCCNPTSGPMSGPVSGSTSGPVSGQKCPVSGSTSGPVSPPSPVLTASCSITGVSSRPHQGQVIAPFLTIYNTGNQTFSPVVQSTINMMGGATTYVVSNRTLNFNQIQPGKSASVRLDRYVVPYSPSKTSLKRTYTIVSNSPHFSCTATATLPSRSPVTTR